jgi:TetR/AcrR family transcriptional regulator, cholesterol catabolism regulator
MAGSNIESRRRAALQEGNAAYIARRQEIIRTAAHVFRDRGIDATTLREVAEALNTDRASLYYYVGSKEELLQEIVRDVLLGDLETAARIKRSRATSAEKVRRLIVAMVTSYAEHYPHMNVYQEDLGRIARQDSEWAVDIIARTRTFEGLVHSILRKAVKDGTLRPDLPVEVAALALFGMVNWMHRWYRPGFKATPEVIAATFADIFMDGYAPRPAPAE